MKNLIRGLALLLLLGSALLGTGALMHPVLAGDAGAQLRTIAADAHWRAIHLVMLAGSGLVIAGIWLRVLTIRDGRRAAAAAGLAVVSIGLAVNALNIAYMAGSGWQLGARFAAGDAAVAGIFEATHPIGLMAARFGNLLVALGAIVLGAAEWGEDGESRLLATLAWLAALGGLAGVAFFDESSRATLAAVALLSGWEVVVAFRGLIPNTSTRD